MKDTTQGITDAIIVLGGGLTPEGAIAPSSQARVDKAVEFHEKHPASLLIMSGKASFRALHASGPTEAQTMREYAIKLGVDVKNIRLEEQSTDTIGNAYYTKYEYLEAHRLRRVMVVTSRFHLERTEYIFRKVLGPAYHAEFVAAYDQQDIDSARMAKEERISAFTHSLLDTMAAGDDTELWRRLKLWHPGYSPQSRITLQQWIDYADKGAVLPAFPKST